MENGAAAPRRSASPIVSWWANRRTGSIASLPGNRHGSRAQVVFVSGDQGIGKTSLVDAFINIVNTDWPNEPKSEHDTRPLIARGQCIRAHGAGEAYMPFLEAFTGLGTSPHRKQIIPLLRRYAPLWLAQMPSLVSSAQLQNLQRSTLGATRERMMREMAEALDAITAETSLILILEDLHWSDYSTLDLISYWAQRRSPSRLLLIATYRPSVVPDGGHPLKTMEQDLQEHGLCQEMQLPILDEAAIREYLQRRFSSHRFPKDIAAWIKQKTAGNPLFMINILDHLMARGQISLRDSRWTLNTALTDASQIIPPTIQQIIERQLEHCTPHEQQLLKAASVKGEEFSAAEAAAVLGEKIEGSAQASSRSQSKISSCNL